MLIDMKHISEVIRGMQAKGILPVNSGSNPGDCAPPLVNYTGAKYKPWEDSHIPPGPESTGPVAPGKAITIK